jgi:hypothetical protein
VYACMYSSFVLFCFVCDEVLSGAFICMWCAIGSAVALAGLAFLFSFFFFKIIPSTTRDR